MHNRLMHPPCYNIIINSERGKRMSDGNYNRNLLPYHNYQSGVRAGKAQMRMLAVKAFEQWYDAAFPDTPPCDKARAKQDFESYLS